MRSQLSLLVAGLIWLGVSPGLALAQEEAPEPPPNPCEREAFRQFDFWVGEWEVRNPEGKVVGHNTIERVLDGCALKESWRGAKGSAGHSFNMYDHTREIWHQTWVGGRGMLLLLEGGLRDGSMVLEGEYPGRDGVMRKQRITWTPKEDGRVRQHWQQSDDGGEWRTVFDGLYVPAE